MLRRWHNSSLAAQLLPTRACRVAAAGSVAEPREHAAAWQLLQQQPPLRESMQQQRGSCCSGARQRRPLVAPLLASVALLALLLLRLPGADCYHAGTHLPRPGPQDLGRTAYLVGSMQAAYEPSNSSFNDLREVLVQGGAKDAYDTVILTENSQVGLLAGWVVVGLSSSSGVAGAGTWAAPERGWWGPSSSSGSARAGNPTHLSCALCAARAAVLTGRRPAALPEC